MPSDMTSDMPLSIPAIVERAAAEYGSAEGLVDGDLLWRYDMAAVGHPMTAHASAKLARAS